MRLIGITTTVPVEVILAAGAVPVDLNNLFISAAEPQKLIALAENDGFPLNTCAWIKGIYGAVLEKGIREVICVTGGDCSNTVMLMEVLRQRGIKGIPFNYPSEPDPAAMAAAIQKLAADLGTTMTGAEEQRRRLLPLRSLSAKADRLTWQDNVLSGQENHVWLVSTSDFNGDPDRFTRDLQSLVDEAGTRPPYPDDELRLGIIGVPPVFAAGLYDFLERQGGRAVFNEVQRQFSMPYPAADLAEQYTLYTYPYATEMRLTDIKKAITERRLDGIIHYVQSFCHRAIGDILMRHEIDLPILTIEGNTDLGISQHLKTRLEAFLDMLRFKKQI
ncbi:MAG: 2-hydroxyacyl-CoA dehydratase [Dehalogenimonas sp.]|uniref:2-hydroxyacyl-CoA dehydratase n=1 Tax=Candidatus Dehalogenimonas loeffleri TaxID=3127115 RepID=A0ABZ2J3E5_9CHLR|nr:2-hydroxyacyl-CoA dehydratase [Dehalogenimonas sp.]